MRTTSRDGPSIMRRSFERAAPPSMRADVVVQGTSSSRRCVGLGGAALVVAVRVRRSLSKKALWRSALLLVRDIVRFLDPPVQCLSMSSSSSSGVGRFSPSCPAPRRDATRPCSRPFSHTSYPRQHTCHAPSGGTAKMKKKGVRQQETEDRTCGPERCRRRPSSSKSRSPPRSPNP